MAGFKIEQFMGGGTPPYKEPQGSLVSDPALIQNAAWLAGLVNSDVQDSTQVSALAYVITAIAREFQRTGSGGWTLGVDYPKGALVLYSDGLRYIATAPNTAKAANAPDQVGAPWISYGLVLRHPFGQPVQTWDFVDANSLPYWLIAANGQTLAVSQYTRLTEYLNSIGRIKSKADYDAGFFADFWAVEGNDLYVPNASGLFYRNSGGLADTIGKKQLDRGRNVTGSFASSRKLRNLSGAFGYSAHDNSGVPESGYSTGGDAISINASRVWGTEHTGLEFNPTNTARLSVINIEIEV